MLYDYERESGRDFEPEKEKSQKKEEFLGTKKADNNVIDLLISFKKKDVRRSPNLVQNEHEHLICAFDSRLRPVSTPARRSNHLSGANNENSVEIKKLLDKKIKQWQKAKTLSLEDFMLFIALELRLRASKKNGNHFSYYISLFDSGDRYTLRISDHHYDASTSEYHNAKKTTALTFSSEITENWDYFKPDKTVHAIEYVYYEDKIGKDELIAIAKDVVSFVENGKYTPSVEPNEVHHSPGLEGVKRTSAKTVESILASGRTDLSEAEKAILRAYAGNGGRMFAAALAAEHDAEDEDLELLELESKALEMELQLALSAEGGESVDGTATDKISVAFNKAIMQYKKGFFKSERTQIFVCKAPQFWSKKGLAIEDVYITVGVIKKAIEKHDLKIEHFINFPDMLREKTNLFISKTTQNAFVQLTELKDLKNHKIVVAVHLKKDKNGNVIIYDIRSVHGRVQRQIDKWIKQGLTIKNKSN